MGTTTIRIDTKTHRQLVEISKASGSTITATVERATEALRREVFAHTVADELASLRKDADAWAGYISESESSTVADGIG